MHSALCLLRRDPVARAGSLSLLSRFVHVIPDAIFCVACTIAYHELFHLLLRPLVRCFFCCVSPQHRKFSTSMSVPARRHNGKKNVNYHLRDFAGPFVRGDSCFPTDTLRVVRT